MEEWINGWMDGWMDGWVGGWVGGYCYMNVDQDEPTNHCSPLMSINHQVHDSDAITFPIGALFFLASVVK